MLLLMGEVSKLRTEHDRQVQNMLDTGELRRMLATDERRPGYTVSRRREVEEETGGYTQDTGLGRRGERGQYTEGNFVGLRKVFCFGCCLFLSRRSKLAKFRIKRKIVACPLNKGEWPFIRSVSFIALCVTRPSHRIVQDVSVGGLTALVTSSTGSLLPLIVHTLGLRLSVP